MKFSDFFKKKTSSDVAKDRLKLVLVSDRSSCSPEIMERIKNDNRFQNPTIESDVKGILYVPKPPTWEEKHRYKLDLTFG